MTPLELHAALVDRTERAGIDLLEQVLKDEYRKGMLRAAEIAREYVDEYEDSPTGKVIVAAILAEAGEEPKP